MRKLVMIIALGLVAMTLHFGAMAGLQAMLDLSTGHTMHAEHAMPMMPTCPIGSICPMVSNPIMGLGSILMIAFGLVLAFIAVLRLPSFTVMPMAAAGPPGLRPNDPTTLLSIFKRE